MGLLTSTGLGLLLWKNIRRWKDRIVGTIFDVLCPFVFVGAVVMLLAIITFSGLDTPILKPENAISNDFFPIDLADFEAGSGNIMGVFGTICFKDLNEDSRGGFKPELPADCEDNEVDDEGRRCEITAFCGSGQWTTAAECARKYDQEGVACVYDNGQCSTSNQWTMAVGLVNAPDSIKSLVTGAVEIANLDQDPASNGGLRRYKRMKAQLSTKEFANEAALETYVLDPDYGIDMTQHPQIAFGLVFNDDQTEYKIRVNETGMGCYTQAGGGWAGVPGLVKEVNTVLLEEETGKSVNFVATIGVIPGALGILQGKLPVLVFSLFGMFGFAIGNINYVKAIVAEKEARVKEGLKIFGLTDWHFWTSWFLSYTLQFLPAWIGIAAISTSLSQTGFIVHFWTWMLFSLQWFSTYNLVGVFFQKAVSAGTAGVMIAIAFVVILPLNVFFEFFINSPALACLLPPIALQFVIQEIIYAQLTTLPSELARVSVVIPGFSMSLGLGMMVVGFLLTLLLTLYFDNVLPKQYGARLHPLYFLQKAYWCGPEAPESRPEREQKLLADSKDVQPIPEHLRKDVKVQIRGLVKEFGGGIGGETVVAVNGINMDMVEGQVFCLLGHNGAGKTTTMDMLTGIQSATRGDATIYDKNISSDIVEIRKSLGYCPQHDVLFPFLTVGEHLQFYGALRGQSMAKIRDEAAEVVKALGMGEKLHAKAPTLSGGQKRKLSLLLSFIGDPKVVFLDEPTSGVDPFARRAMWNFIQDKRKDRVVVLTTHFMDEAEVLGDRIAIMSSGNVVCCGTNLFLKERFGVGYTLSLSKKAPEVPDEPLEAVIDQALGKSEQVSSIATELAYKVPLNASEKFGDFFTTLEEQKDALGLESYGVSVTTLEEVFLKVEHEVHATTKQKMVRTESYMQRAGKLRDQGEGMVGGWSGQLVAMILKRAYLVKGMWQNFILCRLVFPVLLMILPIVTSIDRTINYDPVVLAPPTVFKDYASEYGNIVAYNAEADPSAFSARLTAECANTGQGSYWYGDDDSYYVNTEASCYPGAGQDVCSTIAADLTAFRAGVLANPLLIFNADNSGLMRGMCGNCTCTGTTLACDCGDFSGTERMSIDLSSAECDRPQLQLKLNANTSFTATDPPVPTVTPLNFECLPSNRSVLCRHDCSGEASYPTSYDKTMTSLYETHQEVPAPENVKPCDPEKPCEEVDVTTFRCYDWRDTPFDERYNEDTNEWNTPPACDCGCWDVLATENRFMTDIRYSQWSRAPLGIHMEAKNIDVARDVNSYRSQVLVRQVVAGSPHLSLAEQQRVGAIGVIALSEAIRADTTSDAPTPLKVTAHPLPPNTYDNIPGVADERETAGYGTQYAYALAVAIFFTIQNIAREIQVGSKHQQFVSGVHFLTFWCVNLVWDFAMLLPIPLLFLAIADGENLNPIVGDGTGVWLGVCYLGNLAALGFCYCIASVFAGRLKPATVAIMVYVTAILGYLMTLPVQFIPCSDLEPTEPPVTWEDQFDCVDRHTTQFFMRIATPWNCIIEAWTNLMARDQWTSSGYGDPYSWDVPGGDKPMPTAAESVSEVMGMLAFHAIFWFAMLLLSEFIKTWPGLRKILDPKPKAATDELDTDVKDEQERIASGKANGDIVRLEGLQKYYGNKLLPGSKKCHAVRGVSFAIPEGQVFAFLGTNGAGKTTTMDMLTGKVAATEGDAWMDGHSINKIGMGNRTIGYCPQQNALFPDLTSRQHLEIFGRAKGLTGAALDEAVESLLADLYLTEYADRKFKTYSGGNKRKLGVAVALIGAPSIVFLDEPSTGVDPVSRRFMWDYISQNMEGRAVILTTHSMEEAEALAQRIGIIVDGQLRCIGTAQHLKKTFGGGFQLTIQFKPSLESKEAIQAETDKFKAFLDQTFATATELEAHARTIKYRISPPSGKTLGWTFTELESAKKKFPIETYAISETSLEQIFLDIAGGSAGGYGQKDESAKKGTSTPPPFEAPSSASNAAPRTVELSTSDDRKTASDVTLELTPGSAAPESEPV